jgi:hypothetical protein
MSVASAQSEPAAERATAKPADRPPPGQAGEAALRKDSTPPAPDRKAALREQALADSGVQALLEVFPAEIRDVEEM